MFGGIGIELHRVHLEHHHFRQQFVQQCIHVRLHDIVEIPSAHISRSGIFTGFLHRDYLQRQICIPDRRLGCRGLEMVIKQLHLVETLGHEAMHEFCSQL